MSEKKRIRTSSTLSFAGWCKVVQSKEEECVGCEESSTEMERQCAKLFDTERKCVKLFDTQNVQSNVRRWKVGTTSHHPSSLAEKRFFYESEIFKLVALQSPSCSKIFLFGQLQWTAEKKNLCVWMLSGWTLFLVYSDEKKQISRSGASLNPICSSSLDHPVLIYFTSEHLDAKRTFHFFWIDFKF